MTDPSLLTRAAVYSRRNALTSSSAGSAAGGLPTRRRQAQPRSTTSVLASRLRFALSASDRDRVPPMLTDFTAAMGIAVVPVIFANQYQALSSELTRGASSLYVLSSFSTIPVSWSSLAAASSSGLLSSAAGPAS